MKVFLGGTCNGSTWRNRLIPQLTCDFFNPVVPDWTPEAQAEELVQRETCDFCLYVITPKSNSVYSVAEVVDDSHVRPERTLLVVLNEDEDDDYYAVFDKAQKKSMDAVSKLVARNGCLTFDSLEAVAEFLNTRG